MEEPKIVDVGLVRVTDRFRSVYGIKWSHPTPLNIEVEIFVDNLTPTQDMIRMSWPRLSGVSSK